MLISTISTLDSGSIHFYEVTIDYLSVTVGEVTTDYDLTTTYAFNLRDRMTGTTISTPVANETTGG